MDSQSERSLSARPAYAPHVVMPRPATPLAKDNCKGASVRPLDRVLGPRADSIVEHVAPWTMMVIS